MDDSLFQQRYAALNEAQRRAVDQIEGPVLVVAGPGSGKTELLSLRVANILRLTDTSPSSILCLTFTEAAATNMRQRLLGLIGSDAYRVAIHTFHSFGSEIIQNYPEYFYSGALTHPADALVQLEVLSDILHALKVDNPLKSYHPDQGYTYLSDIRQRIDELKKAGLSSAEFLAVLTENQSFLEKASPLIQDFFSERISKKSIGRLEVLLSGLRSLGSTGSFSSESLLYRPLSITLVESLQQAYESCIFLGKTTPLTEWKKAYTQQNRLRQTLLKDAATLEKHKELAHVYERYQTELHERGYFDFADMILQVVEALQSRPDLKYTLQEKYLYLLVDEFQDTSGVQLRMLDALLDAEIHEGRPNILAVGDDDQAIYKFQGANLHNILTFHERYRDPEMVVLTENYRSTQAILDLVRPIILQGQDRLETRFPDQIKKELKAAALSLVGGVIVEQMLSTSEQEFQWVATQIKESLRAGIPASEIAVIAPKHLILRDFVPFLQRNEIPFAYEQNQDLLQDPSLQGLLLVLEFVDSLYRHDLPEADELLPSLLSLPFWGISSSEIWRISIEAYRKQRFWLEIMKEHEDPKIQNVALFLIEMAMLAQTLTAEELLDRVIGTRPSEFFSPYKSYYFNEERRHDHPESYFHLLSTIEAFIQAFRAHKGAHPTLTLKDLMAFVQLHRKHRISLSRSTAFLPDENAIHLLTAHKAKGLEFDTVFVLHCTEEAWTKGQHFNKLSFPSNLPLSPEADHIGDRLRLFYVSLTRAKRHLYLTHHQRRDDSKPQLRLRFLESVLSPPVSLLEESKIPVPDDFSFAKPVSLLFSSGVSLEREFLKKRLENYQLSVTHFNDFLNVASAGPRVFFENHVLKFPQRPYAQQSYGTALHLALHHFQSEFKRTGQLPSSEFLQARFEQALSGQRLNHKDLEEYREKGIKELLFYYEQRKTNFALEDHSEFNFERQGVRIGDAPITGKIDRLRVDPVLKEAIVYDYKTGKPLLDWRGRYESEKIKAWTYRNQFFFYKLLVEHAREFKSLVTVREGVFEFLTPHEGQLQQLVVENDPLFLERVSRLIPRVYEKIVHLDFPATEHYPKNLQGIEQFMEDLLSGSL